MLRNAALIALGLSLASPPALANDGAFYGRGATVVPVTNAAIVMAKEDLHIRQGGPTIGYYVDHWQISVDYVFHNDSTTKQTVQMGFPESCVATPDNVDEDGNARCTRWTIKGFTAQVDGKTVRTTIKKKGAKEPKGLLAGVNYDRVHTFSVSFAPGQKRKVQHRYTFEGAMTSPFTSELEYILQTGALWKGAIGELNIQLSTVGQFEQIESRSDFPKPTRTMTEDGWTSRSWELKNYEPTQDLMFGFTHPKGVARVEAIEALGALTDAELAKKSKLELRQLRNTVYAAYGAQFEDVSLNEHFLKVGWYRPRLDYDAKWVKLPHRKLISRIKAFEDKAKR